MSPITDDDEYDIQLDVAGDMFDYLPVLFEITYLIASRGVETLDIKLSQIDSDRTTGGIYVDRRKGSDSNIIEWPDRLYEAYQAALKLHQKHKIARKPGVGTIKNRIALSRRWV